MRLIKEYKWCKEYDIDCLTIDIYDDYITIWNSYKITKISHMLEVIETIRKYSRIYNRSNFQLVSEWRSHNLLYDLNYERLKVFLISIFAYCLPLGKIWCIINYYLLRSNLWI